MAGKATREILVEDIEQMDSGMKRLSSTRQDIWQDELVWWLCKAVRDILLWIVERGAK